MVTPRPHQGVGRLTPVWTDLGCLDRDTSDPAAPRASSAIWDDPADTTAVIAYARGFLADMEPYASGGLYVNFAGFGEEGEQLVKEAYGASYTRLVALKNQYDPTNLFRLNQNITPTA